MSRFEQRVGRRLATNPSYRAGFEEGVAEFNLEETATRGTSGLGLANELCPGDWVSMHWDWSCDRLSRRQLVNLRRYSMLELDVTNRHVSHPGAAVVLS